MRQQVEPSAFLVECDEFQETQMRFSMRERFQSASFRMVRGGLLLLTGLTVGGLAYGQEMPHQMGMSHSMDMQHPPEGRAVVVPPSLSPQAQRGKAAFDAVCAKCHGANGGGTDKGPPFLHPFYAAGHHGDEAFFRAVHNGVRHHHWNFGDMPPQPQVRDEDVAAIVAYVRELQAANGVMPPSHPMNMDMR